MTTKVNPVATTNDVEMIGKEVQLFTIDYINAVNGSAGPNGVQKAVLDNRLNRQRDSLHANDYALRHGTHND